MFVPPNNRKTPPDDKPDGSNNNRPQPPQFQFPRWSWLIFLGVLLLWSLLRLPDMMNSVSPAQPIYNPVLGLLRPSNRR